MVEATKEHPAPLDGYIRAKPDEPIFTLQGGDPFALEAIRFYIQRRREAGIKLPAGKKRDAELLRCTQAEEVLWRMEDYARGIDFEPGEPADTPAEPAAVKTILDLHDFRVRAAQRISGMFSDLNDIRLELLERGWMRRTNALHSRIEVTIDALREHCSAIEPRKAMQTGGKNGNEG